MRIFLLFFFFGLSVHGYCQNLQSDSVNKLILAKSFEAYKYREIPPRNLLAFENNSFSARLNPLRYVSAGLLFFYQRMVSEQIQAECNYETSCSEYTKLAIKRYGLPGFFMGIDQWNHCTENVFRDYPPYKISQNHKIINKFED
jgi:putative component of membrane protein insertase Oxa1/YidC/SpoIIIJ protein YidD